MSSNRDFERHDSAMGDEWTETLNMSNETEADMIHETENEQHDKPPSSDTINETHYEYERAASRPQSRANASSFAAPTKASEAKKNEKIELAQSFKRSSSAKEPHSRPGSAMRQYSASVHDNRRPGVQRRGISASKADREYANAAGYSMASVEWQEDRRRGMKRSSFGSGSGGGGGSVGGEWSEGEEEEDEESIMLEGKETEDVEPEHVERDVQVPGKGLNIEEGESREEEEVASSRMEEEKLGDELPEEKVLEEQVRMEEAQTGEEQPMQKEEKLKDVEEVFPDEEPLEHRVESFETEESGVEVETLQQQKSPLTQDNTAPVLQNDRVERVEAQIPTPKDQIESMSEHVTEEDAKGSVETISSETNNMVPAVIVAEIEEIRVELQKAEEQRDEAMRQRETMQQELQMMQEDAEKLKQDHEKLSAQLRESEAKIAARNAREPGLPPLEEAEADNKRLRAAVEQTRLELEKNQIDLIEASSCCRQLDDQLLEVQEKLKSHDVLIKGLRELVGQVAENVPQIARCSASELDQLFNSLAQDTEIDKLRGEFLKLIKSSNENFRKEQESSKDLKGQLADQRFENTRLRKAMEIQKTELLSPGVQSPHESQDMQMGQYYKSERLKRQTAEQELAKAKKLLLHLGPENQELQVNLTKAQEELADLRPKVKDLEKKTKEWKKDSEEKNLLLELRTVAFDANATQQQHEVLRYIADYYQKTKDEAHWEVQGLQKKLAASEKQYETLLQSFKREKVHNVRLEDAVTRLKKSVKARNIHIEKMYQAFMRQAPCPLLRVTPSGSRTPDSDTSSPTSSTSSSSSEISPYNHPDEVVNTPPPIPRCHLPTAIEARQVKLKAYKKQLEEAREAEIFMLSVKPRVPRAKGDDSDMSIMEQVKKWRMGSDYPPAKSGWNQVKRQSAWDRWEGESWARQCAKGKDVDFLRKVGLCDERWAYWERD